MIYLYNIDDVLVKLKNSKFRNKFHLNEVMKQYVEEKGFDTIKLHAYDIIYDRLREAFPKNDGKQTPMKQVHPIFIAQHACACCCRGCLEKWHNISRGRELDTKEIDYIVRILMEWIKREMEL